MLILTVLLQSAWAGSGLQARLYDGAFDVARGLVEGETFSYAAEELGGEYDCWDYVGVLDLSLDIPIEEVEIGLDDSALSVWVRFGDIEGEDWVLYATDEDWLDTCPEFETEVNRVALEDAALYLRVAPEVDDGQVRFRVVDDLELIGELETDIEWVPDDLVLSFFEDEIVAAIAASGADMLEETLSDYIDEALFSGAVGDYELSFVPAQADVDSDGVSLGAEGALHWTGGDGCPQQDPPDDPGRAPALSFQDPGDADLAVGVTEAMVGGLLQGLWADGWFCFTEEDLSELLALVQDAFDPGVGGLAATASLDDPPTLEIGPDGLSLLLAGLNVSVTGDGEALLDATLDLSGRLELGLDPSIGSFTLSVHDLALDVRELRADHLVSGAESEADLSGFLERWATGWIEDQSQDLVLFATLYRAFGFVVRSQRMDLQEGGLVVFLSLYEESDPEVDTRAPDTTVSVSREGGDVTASWSGEDDRAGALAFSWRLDGGSWSSWTEEAGVVLEELDPGEHNIEVMARDSWWNTDASPASASFKVEMEPEPEAEKRGGCGCGAGGSASGVGALAALALVARRRRVSSPS